MNYVLSFFILLLIFTNIKSLIRYRRVKKYLSNNFNINYTIPKDKLYIVIPVYNEVKNIEKSIEYFKKLDQLCNIYYVTTSKETGMETYHEIEKQIAIQKTTNIFLDNCPNEQGTMAHQLNYMTKKLPKDSVIGIYNIDSFPEKKTFMYVIDNIGNNEVFQQVSYFDNINKNGILKSAQNWQNRWSIIYEMGKYLKKSGCTNFIYTIGHGLFLKKEILDKYGYWSEKEINEDNEFGYRMICNNIQIKPIPFLEKADFAKSLKIYIKQQSTWVNGPLYAFSYYYNTEKKSLRKFWLALLNFKAFFSWMFFPIISLIFIILALIYNNIALIFILCLIMTYISYFNYKVNRLLIKNGYLKHNIILNIIYDYIFFIIHSFGSFITVFKIVSKSNNQANKYNTEK